MNSALLPTPPQPTPEEVAAKRKALVDDIAAAINKNSAENGSNTPDFILAEYLVGCMEAFNVATKSRTRWYDVPEVDADRSRMFRALAAPLIQGPGAAEAQRRFVNGDDFRAWESMDMTGAPLSIGGLGVIVTTHWDNLARPHVQLLVASISHFLGNTLYSDLGLTPFLQERKTTTLNDIRQVVETVIAQRALAPPSQTGAEGAYLDLRSWQKLHGATPQHVVTKYCAGCGKRRQSVGNMDCRCPINFQLPSFCVGCGEPLNKIDGVGLQCPRKCCLTIYLSPTKDPA